MATDTSKLLLRFHANDSQFGVTRSTLRVLATKLEISEVDVIHLALSRMVRGGSPTYAPDGGPLSAQELAALRVHASIVLPRGALVSRKKLF